MGFLCFWPFWHFGILVFSLCKGNVSACLLWLVFIFNSFFLPIFLRWYQSRGENSGKIPLSWNVSLPNQSGTVSPPGYAEERGWWLIRNDYMPLLCNDAERVGVCVCVKRLEWHPDANGKHWLELMSPPYYPLDILNYKRFPCRNRVYYWLISS